MYKFTGVSAMCAITYVADDVWLTEPVVLKASNGSMSNYICCWWYVWLTEPVVLKASNGSMCNYICCWWCVAHWACRFKSIRVHLKVLTRESWGLKLCECIKNIYCKVQVSHSSYSPFGQKLWGSDQYSDNARSYLTDGLKLRVGSGQYSAKVLILYSWTKTMGGPWSIFR